MFCLLNFTKNCLGGDGSNQLGSVLPVLLSNQPIPAGGPAHSLRSSHLFCVSLLQVAAERGRIFLQQLLLMVEDKMSCFDSILM